MNSPEFFDKWEGILNSVEKEKIPVQFIKKMVLRLYGRKQHTINIEKLLDQGFDLDEIEDIVTEKLIHYDDKLLDIEFVLDIKSVANTVEPETNDILRKI